MALLDHLNILAAVIYGACITRTQKQPNVPKDDQPASAPTSEAPRSWGTATEEEKEACQKAVRFLKSFVHTAPIPSVDRDAAAMSLATTMKGTALSALNPNYRQVVEIILCGLQVDDTQH